MLRTDMNLQQRYPNNCAMLECLKQRSLLVPRWCEMCLQGARVTTVGVTAFLVQENPTNLQMLQQSAQTAVLQSQAAPVAPLQEA